MRFGSTKTWGIGAAAAGLLFAAYSIGTQADSGVASGAGPKARLVAGPGPGPGRPAGPMLQDLADRLGVDRQKLEDAMAAIRGQQQPPAGGPRDDFAAELAAKLGIDQAKVEQVLDAHRPKPPEPPAGPGRRTGGAPHFRTGRGGPGGPDIAGLAKDLGVDESKLKTALDELRKQHEGDFKARRDEFAKQLADRLGIDVEKVKAALPEPPHAPFRARP
jgi:hypothetical protein